jgi:hypothetical protein
VRCFAAIDHHLRCGSPETVQASAETSVRIVKGLLPLALEGNRAQRDAGARELMLVLERYLGPVDETKQPRKPGKPFTR